MAVPRRTLALLLPAALAVTAAPAVAASRTAPAPLNPTVGRLTAKDPVTGKKWNCTAAVVKSDNRNLILTAGHCMSKQGESYKYTDFRFSPGSHTGNPSPYGVFKGFRANTVRGWAERGDIRYDFGFVNLSPNAAGKNVGEVVGENRIIVNQTYTAHRTVVSQAGLSDEQVQCFGETRPAGPPPESRVALDCDLPEGSSGAPWFVDYNPASRGNVINGLLSTVNDEGVNKSPFFDDAIWEQYQRSATY